MKRNFTDEDIIRFLYDEMNRQDSEAFLDALCTDEQLWERYEYFQEVVEKVSELRFEPSKFSCDKIMDAVHASNPAHPAYVEPVTPTSSSKFLKNWLPLSLNLNAVIIMGLILFVSIAVTGTFLKLQRGAIDNPNTGSLVQQVDTEHESLYQWDDTEIEMELQNIREGLEGLEDQEKPVM